MLVLRSEVVRDNVWPYGSLRAAVQFSDLVPVAPRRDASVYEELVEVALMFLLCELPARAPDLSLQGYLPG